MKTAHLKNFHTNILFCQKCERSTGIICLFTPITLYSVFPLLATADKVTEVQCPHGLITEYHIA